MNVLLTGATGFLGSHVLKSLLQEGYEVAILKRSSSDCKRIAGIIEQCRVYDSDYILADEIFQKQEFDAVIHCATEYGTHTHSDQVIISNLVFPVQLLEAAISAQCPYFINTDSFFTKQVPERLEKDQALYKPEYTLSKYQFREWGKLRAIEGKINFINLQMEHIYGPDDREEKFVSFLTRAMQSGTEELDLTDGIQIRDFIHVDDAVMAYLTVLSHCEDLSGYHHFEVGTGVSRTIREFVECIHDELDATTKLNFGKKTRSEREIMFSTARTTQLLRLGWKVTHTSEKMTGIKS